MTVSTARFGALGVRKVGSEQSGQPLKDRRCIVTLENRKELVPNKFTPGVGSQPVLVINAEENDLRVRFKIKRDIVWTPNAGSIEVFNLSPENRAKAQGKNHRVTLLAGYGFNLRQVAVLSAQQINHKHEGPDWISKFEGGDAGRHHFHARVNKSYAAGTPQAQAVKDTLGALGVVPQSSLKLLNERAGGRTFKNGKVLYARAVEEARYLLRELGLEYTVVDEEVLLFPKDGTTTEVHVISPDSGLVGSPEYAAPPTPKQPQLLKVKTLMIPELRPGSLVVVRSATHNGEFRCRSVEHSGDTWANEWFSTLELQALKGGK
jgi:hypothetical protein